VTLETKPFGDIITFTRAGEGGRFNALGQYEMVPANTPRLTHDPVTLQPLGILIEEQRANLLLQSGNPALAPWTNDSVTLGTPVAGPLGNELPVYETATSAFFRVRQQASSVVAGSAYTYTFNIKKLGRRYVYIRSQARTLLNENIGFDLDTLTTTFVPAGWTASIKIVSPGIYQLVATCTATTSNSIVHGFLSSDTPISNNAILNYVGDPAQGFVYISGQLELGASPSSYIPTGASQVTRAADVCSVNTLSPWFNAAAGALVVEFIPAPGLVGFRNVVTMGSGAGNTLFMSLAAAGVAVGGVASTTPALSGVPASIKSAMAYQVSQPTTYARNGELRTAPANMPGPAVFTTLAIGRATTYSGDFFNGTISRITYYPRALSVAELQAITA